MVYDRILEIAKKKGVSLRRIEEEAGMGNGAISKWKSSSPRVDSVLAVAQVLDIEISELLKRTEENGGEK